MVYKKTGDPEVDGKGNTDDQIVGLLIALLFAGQHTSSITSTWTALFLAHDKQLMARAQQEIAAVQPKVCVKPFQRIALTWCVCGRGGSQRTLNRQSMWNKGAHKEL